MLILRHYGRVIDKFNNSFAIAIFSVNLRITNGAIVEKRAIICLLYLLNEFGDLS